MVTALIPTLVLIACSSEPSTAPSAPSTPPHRALPEGHPPTGAPPAPAGSAVDPGESGITDLARLSRYVFAQIQADTAGCTVPTNPWSAKLEYELQVDVKDGKVNEFALSGVGLMHTDGVARLVPEPEWPGDLVRQVDCLAPGMKAMAMDPAPADGPYRPVFALMPNPAGATPP